MSENPISTSTAELEARCHLLFDVSALPMWIVDAADERFVAVNEAALRYFDFAQDEFLRLTPWDLQPAGSKSPEYRCKDGRIVQIATVSHALTFGGRRARLVVAREVPPPGHDNEIRQLNLQLEQRVQERTVLLQNAMKELEAFSYSVSHDLRTPLRGIDGLSHALFEDHGDRLDDDGRRMLQLIRSETRRMTQLIDDLLAFSRAGRQEVDAGDINMTDLADSAFQNLVESSPGRRAPEFVLAPLPPARGDRAMIRQVFANLLNNALKFSSRQAAPRIELGGWSEPGRQVYCVRDNGVGFDQRYASKLFGVFQRLHSQQEFEGTGVGLALVQRIVQRNGGEVWAEGQVGGGAAFYFTLPEAKGTG